MIVESGLILLGVSAVPYLVYLFGITFGKKCKSIPLLKEWPPISIIISAYNEEQNLETRIKNLSDCNYLNREIIFVDDCSTDKTLELAKKYMDGYSFKYTLIHNDKRLGTSASYNKAFKESAHELVIVTDADTTFKPGALQIIVSRLMSNTAIGAVTETCNRNQMKTLPETSNTSTVQYTAGCVNGKVFNDSTYNFNGAFMALKKSAVKYINEQAGADDANAAFSVIRNGYRAVYEKDAVVYEKSTGHLYYPEQTESSQGKRVNKDNARQPRFTQFRSDILPILFYADMDVCCIPGIILYWNRTVYCWVQYTGSLIDCSTVYDKSVYPVVYYQPVLSCSGVIAYRKRYSFLG